MSFLVTRDFNWRHWVGLFAALIAALVTFMAIGRTPRPREEEPRVRLVDADTTAHMKATRAEMARIASLWLEGRGVECLVPATYGPDESARFSPVMLSRTQTRAPAVLTDGPVGALWARLANVYDAGALARTVEIEPAEPAIVTIARASRFVAQAA